jgi:tyrosyl-tRNA synthetase
MPAFMQVDSEGKKIGNSEGGGAAWLSAGKLSPYKFYQYMFKTADADVIKFLKMLTFLPLDRIQQLEVQMREEGYVPNTAQRLLAEEVTRYVHGEGGLEVRRSACTRIRIGCSACTRMRIATAHDGKVLEDGAVPFAAAVTLLLLLQAAKRTTAALKPGAVTELDAQMLEDIAGDAPSTELSLQDALRPVPEVMATVGLQPSKAAAKRFVFQPVVCLSADGIAA